MASSLSFSMLLKIGTLLLCLNCVVTTENYENELPKDRVTDFTRFSHWPSVHNAARLLRNRRDAQSSGDTVGQSEGGVVEAKPPSAVTPPPAVTPSVTPASAPKELNNTTPVTKIEPQKDQITKVPGNTTTTLAPAVTNANETKATNITVSDKSTASDIDLNNPGVVKRGFIVFGGFALMAVAYFIFYRRKSKKNESSNSHSTIDANQFRYGVLQSEDRRDNLELSRVPLTMESDEEEEEDLEIFDLEQKKKSLSYVNLQMNDEDIVLSHPENNREERDNLLLDIEDGTSDTLINWSSSGSKSIL